MIDRREFLLCAGAMALDTPLALADDADRMLTRTIPSSGEALPVVGLGNSSVFSDNDYENSKLLLDVLRDKGGRFIDIHGASEEPIGRYMNEHDAHDDLFIGTNLYINDAMTGDERVQLSQSVQGKDPLDLLFLPRPSAIDRQWPQFRDWKEQGATRYIGVAATGPRFFDMYESLINSGTADFIQINYSMLEPQAGERLLPLARERGVAVIVNRPFSNGNYFPLVAGKSLPEWTAEFDCESWAQFSLKFILANPAVTCVITETSKSHHAIDNLSAGSGRLPDAATRQRMLELVTSFG